MSYGVESIYAKNPMDFIPPPSYALWLRHTRNGSGNFTIFKDLPQMKAQVTRATYGGLMHGCDALMYEFKGGQWVEFAIVRDGEKPKDHPLWNRAAKRGPGVLEVPENEVDGAIQSILASVGSQPEEG